MLSITHRGVLPVTCVARALLPAKTQNGSAKSDSPRAICSSAAFLAFGAFLVDQIDRLVSKCARATRRGCAGCGIGGANALAKCLGAVLGGCGYRGPFGKLRAGSSTPQGDSLRESPFPLRMTNDVGCYHSLRQRVLPSLDRLLRDLLAQSNRVEGLVFGQPPQDGQLRPQHVTFGHVGDDLLRRRLDFL
jgi:hypothetical protein